MLKISGRKISLKDFRHVFEVIVGETNIDDTFFQFGTLVDRVSQAPHVALQLLLTDL